MTRFRKRKSKKVGAKTKYTSLAGRKSPKYARWRTAVYERDNHTCQVCGKKGGWLNAHHLNGWSWAKAQRFSVRNGVTMCANKGGCHQKFHEKYGKGKNTRAQFLQFKRDYNNE